MIPVRQIITIEKDANARKLIKCNKNKTLRGLDFINWLYIKAMCVFSFVSFIGMHLAKRAIKYNVISS